MIVDHFLFAFREQRQREFGENVLRSIYQKKKNTKEREEKEVKDKLNKQKNKRNAVTAKYII